MKKVGSSVRTYSGKPTPNQGAWDMANNEMFDTAVSHVLHEQTSRHKEQAPVKLKCQYCGKPSTRNGLNAHEAFCPSNKNRRTRNVVTDDMRAVPQYACRFEYQRTFTLPNTCGRHEISCELNPNRKAKVECGKCHKPFNTIGLPMHEAYCGRKKNAGKIWCLG